MFFQKDNQNSIISIKLTDSQQEADEGRAWGPLKYTGQFFKALNLIL